MVSGGICRNCSPVSGTCLVLNVPSGLSTTSGPVHISCVVSYVGSGKACRHVASLRLVACCGEVDIIAISFDIVHGDKCFVSVVGVGGQTREVVRHSSSDTGQGNNSIVGIADGFPFETAGGDGYTAGVGDGCIQRSGGLCDTGSSVGGYSRIGNNRSTAGNANVDIVNAAAVVGAVLVPMEADVAVGGNVRTGEINADGVAGGGYRGDCSYLHERAVQVVEVGHITYCQLTVGGAFHGAPEVEVQRVQRLVECRQGGICVGTGTAAGEHHTIAALGIMVTTAGRDNVRGTIGGVLAVGCPAGGCYTVGIVVCTADVTVKILTVWKRYRSCTLCCSAYDRTPCAVVGGGAYRTDIELIGSAAVQVLHLIRMCIGCNYGR